MKRYFLKLYRYNAWANASVIDALKVQKVADAQILTLVGHILAAEFIWLSRLTKHPAPDVKLWGEYTLQQLSDMARREDDEWVTFVENTDDFKVTVTYKSLAGEEYSNDLETIVVHVANHGSYHRGQIALLMRQKGFQPVNTDFIIYDRILSGQMRA